MTKRAVAHKKTLVDPVFSLLPGSEDEFVYSRENADGELLLDGIEPEEDEDDEFDDFDDDSIDSEFELETPEDFEVITQTIRRAPTGHQVVDVVIEAEEVEGAADYEIQVVKL